MGYSARRGFSSGSMKPTGAQRQAEVQQKIAQMQEAMAAAQEAVEAKVFTASAGGGAVEAKVTGKKRCSPLPSSRRRWIRRMWRCSRIWWSPPSTRRCARRTRPWSRAWAASPAGWTWEASAFD